MTIDQIKDEIKRRLKGADPMILFGVIGIALLFVVAVIVGQINEHKEKEQRLIQEASMLGFSSVPEMKELQAKGFTSKYEYDEDQAKKEGFESLAEKNDLKQKGFNTKQEYLDAEEKAKQAGWATYAEKLEANSKSIDDPKQYHALLAEEEKQRQREAREQERARAQEQRKKDNEVYCYMYKQALDACATAFDTNKCLNIKLPYGDLYKYQSACY